MDSSRDRRAILAIVIGVLVGPAVIGFMVNQLAERQRQAEEVRIPVVGAAQRAGVRRLAAAAVRASTIVDGPAAIRSAPSATATRTSCVVIPTDFAEKLRRVARRRRQARRRRLARLRAAAGQPRARAAAALQLGDRRAAAGRARRQPRSGRRPLRVDEVEVSTAQQRAATILNFLGLFMLLVGAHRRRCSSPPTRRPANASAARSSRCWSIRCRAARSSAASGWRPARRRCIAVGLTMGFCVRAAEARARARISACEFASGRRRCGTMLLAALSVCPLSAALQACVGTYSRSFKEAQSYMGILMTLPVMAIGVVGAIYPLTVTSCGCTPFRCCLSTCW